MKKLISLVLCLVLALTVIVSTVNAEDGLTFYGESDTGSYGEIFSVSVKIKNNPGIMGFSMMVKYDEKVLKPLSTIKGEVLTTGLYDDSIDATLSENENGFKVVWTGTKNIDSDGEIFKIEFLVIDYLDSTTEIELLPVKDDSVFNEEYNDVSATYCKIVVPMNYYEKSTSSTTTESVTIPSEDVEPNESQSTQHIHSKYEWTVVKESTYFEKGIKIKKCIDCGESVAQQKINKLKLKTPKLNVTVLKRGVIIKYKKIKNASGFQVGYKKLNDKKWKTQIYGTKKDLKVIIKKLTSGKKYQFKIRSYIKKGSRKAYSSWSSVKKCRIK